MPQMTATHAKQIAKKGFVIASSTPAGGLMAWASDLVWQYREAARFVDKILRGAKPGDLPVQYPPRYYLTVDAVTARDLGLTLPPALLAQADRVLT
jgi:putative ABC transport system substrate-binding protein